MSGSEIGGRTFYFIARKRRRRRIDEEMGDVLRVSIGQRRTRGLALATKVKARQAAGASPGSVCLEAALSASGIQRKRPLVLLVFTFSTFAFVLASTCLDQLQEDHRNNNNAINSNNFFFFLFEKGRVDPQNLES